MFHDYMEQFNARTARGGLVRLFRVLNQKPEAACFSGQTGIVEFPGNPDYVFDTDSGGVVERARFSGKKGSFEPFLLINVS